ncbi:MAG: SLC5/6 family protein [Planctomycetota bacterium]
MSNGALPDYLSMAKPNPLGNRAAWYKNTAPTYAGIMLWFVFWQDVPTGAGAVGGVLSHGLGTALVGLILAALLCHFLYYLVPAMLGMKTGLPLYIVGTSTYGASGGFLMPGFLMGLLQFGWLGVNSCFSAAFLVKPFYPDLDLMGVISTPPHIIVAIAWAAAAAFMGLKGIQYVARVATYLPLIPLTILVVLFFCSVGGVGSFGPAQVGVTADAEGALSAMGVIAVLLTYVIGFFATAGAAGTDFGMNSRDDKDVQMGGLLGISGATILAGGLALVIVAGAFGSGKATDASVLNPTQLMGALIGEKTGLPARVLLLVHCRQQLQDHFAESESLYHGRYRHSRQYPACRDGLGSGCDVCLRGNWSFVWPGMRRDDGGLHNGRQEMGRSSGQLEPGGLDFLGCRLYRGHDAARESAARGHCKHPGRTADGLYRRGCALFRPGQGGSGVESCSDGRGTGKRVRQNPRTMFPGLTGCSIRQGFGRGLNPCCFFKERSNRT